MPNLNEQIVRFQPEKVINIGQFFTEQKWERLDYYKQRLKTKD